MNDLDTTIKTLLNSAVDTELGGHRAAPPINRAALADRPGPAHVVRLWSAPLLAASVAVLLAVGAMLGITLNRDHNHVRTPAGPVPAPSASASLSRSTNADLEAARRAYDEAVAGAQEATEVPGVSVGPLSANDAKKLKGTGLYTGDISSITAPEPDKIYSFILSYLAGPSDDPPGVLTSEVQDVASGSCAQPFLARPGHAYRVQCHAILMAGAIGKGTLTLRTPTGLTSGSMNLTDPAREFADAVASAPEASTVAGVSDRRETAEELRRGATVGILGDGPGVPEKGRSYPVALLYIPPSDAPPVSVLSIRIEDVTVGRCPGAFRIRTAHAYVIHCQVTFRAGAPGRAYYDLTEPRGKSTPAGLDLSLP